MSSSNIFLFLMVLIILTSVHQIFCRIFFSSDLFLSWLDEVINLEEEGHRCVMPFYILSWLTFFCISILHSFKGIYNVQPSHMECKNYALPTWGQSIYIKYFKCFCIEVLLILHNNFVIQILVWIIYIYLYIEL